MQRIRLHHNPYRRRISPMTCSPGTGVTAPLRISARRRSASISHVRATSSSGKVCDNRCSYQIANFSCSPVGRRSNADSSSIAVLISATCPMNTAKTNTAFRPCPALLHAGTINLSPTARTRFCCFTSKLTNCRISSSRALATWSTSSVRVPSVRLWSRLS